MPIFARSAITLSIALKTFIMRSSSREIVSALHTTHHRAGVQSVPSLEGDPPEGLPLLQPKNASDPPSPDHSAPHADRAGFRGDTGSSHFRLANGARPACFERNHHAAQIILCALHALTPFRCKGLRPGAGFIAAAAEVRFVLLTHDHTRSRPPRPLTPTG